MNATPLARSLAAACAPAFVLAHTLTLTLTLAACGGDPERGPGSNRPLGRIYSAEEVQREARELVAREAEARARFKALSELRARLAARGAAVPPLPPSPGLPKERHDPSSGLSEAALAERMARLQQANAELASFLPRLDRLRRDLLQRSVQLGIASVAEQLDAIELAGSGTLRIALVERELALDLVYVPPGRGVLGLNLDDPHLPFPLERRGLARVTTTPPVEVVVAEGFFLQRSELTRAELAQIRGLPAPEGDAAALPATEITWREAIELASAIRHPQLLVRLPSEVEWEYAARYDSSGRPRFYPWGGPQTSATIDVLSKMLTSAEHAGPDRSALDLLHLAGNAREWTLDAWRERRWEALAPSVVHHAARVEPPKSAPEQVAVRSNSAGAAAPLHFEGAYRAAELSAAKSSELSMRCLVLRRSELPADDHRDEPGGTAEGR